jgi:tRNA 2-(methylsulfanyl)-N6-isopentenyladenosine37 hydroxylase
MAGCRYRLTMFELHAHSSSDWLDAVMGDFDSFLLDHAGCERKASSTGMNFVVRYPDRTYLIEPMIELALEELEHFHEVYKLIRARGLQLKPDEKDPYVNWILKGVRSRGDERLMDRLIVAGVLEARGCERFGLIAEALDPGPEKLFYEELTRSEARHHGMFLRVAKHYFDDDVVDERLGFFLDNEAEAIAALPVRAALH